MSFRKPTNLKDSLMHLGALIGSGSLIVIIVFYIWLPTITNHGETITVPDIQGKRVNELEEFLSQRKLRFEVNIDSGYSPDYPPLAVLRQVPAPNNKVKENRKIYVTLNSELPPKVHMPKVKDRSLKSAMMVIKSYGLKLGSIKYEPYEFFNLVYGARINGKVINEGEIIKKGSLIDLIVGNGYGNNIFQSPLLIGLEQEEAKIVIIGSGLKIGTINITNSFVDNVNSTDFLNNEIIDYKDIKPGTVHRQHPLPQQRVKTGDPIDIWIYQPDSVNHTTTTILDNQ